MCYICKYINWKYMEYPQHQKIEEFIKYVHENKIPLQDLYKAIPQFIDDICPNHTRKYKTSIRIMLRSLITYISQKENQKIIEDIPTYRMSKNGEYVRVR